MGNPLDQKVPFWGNTATSVWALIIDLCSLDEIWTNSLKKSKASQWQMLLYQSSFLFFFKEYSFLYVEEKLTFFLKKREMKQSMLLSPILLMPFWQIWLEFQLTWNRVPWKSFMLLCDMECCVLELNFGSFQYVLFFTFDHFYCIYLESGREMQCTSFC